MSDCFYFLRYWAICSLQMFCYPGCEVKNFEINLIFLIKLLFCLTKKSREKVKYFEKEKSFLKWNKKHFSSILKSIQLLKLSQSWEFAFKTNYDNINKKLHHKFVVKLSQHWKKLSQDVCDSARKRKSFSRINWVRTSAICSKYPILPLDYYIIKIQ